MQGEIAAARAYHEAGNYKLALRHAERALQSKPEDREALDVYCDAQLKLQNFSAVETAAVDWIARQPQDVRAYINLLLCYAARKDKKKAQVLVQHFRAACPYHGDGIKMLDAVFDLRFGEQTDGLAELAGFARRAGDGLREKYWKTRHLFSDGDFAAAHASALEALRLGADDEDAHLSAAFTSYRTLRLFSALRHANQALARNPGLADAREVKLWVFASFFPPFFLALWLFKAVMKPTPSLLWSLGNRIEIGLLLLLPVIAAAHAQRHLGVPVALPLIVLVISFFLAQMLFGKASQWRKRRQAAPVQLKPF